MSRVDYINDLFEKINENLLKQTDERVRELEADWSREDRKVKRMVIDGKEAMVYMS